MVSEFDDPEQLIAEAGISPTEESGGFLKSALLPHPAMPQQGQSQRRHRKTENQNRRPQRRGRIQNAIQDENEEKGNAQTDETSECAFRDFDRPESLAELLQFLLQAWRQRQITLRCPPALCRSVGIAHYV